VAVYNRSAGLSALPQYLAGPASSRTSRHRGATYPSSLIIRRGHPFGAVFGQEENSLFSFTLGSYPLESFSYGMGAERYPHIFPNRTRHPYEGWPPFLSAAWGCKIIDYLMRFAPSLAFFLFLVEGRVDVVRNHGPDATSRGLRALEGGQAHYTATRPAALHCLFLVVAGIQIMKKLGLVWLALA
jgi:hypothetical protein